MHDAFLQSIINIDAEQIWGFLWNFLVIVCVCFWTTVNTEKQFNDFNG